MSMLRRFTLGLAVLTLAFSTSMAARQDVSPADVQRLQDLVNDAGMDVAALRRTDPTGARSLQSELDELQEDVIYVKVSLRRQEDVPRSDYSALRDRLESLRSRARGEEVPPAQAAAPASAAAETAAEAAPATAAQAASAARETADAAPGNVPVGTELDVRLQSALNSGTAAVEDRFEATTVIDLKGPDGILIPAGTVVRGLVTAVQSAGRVERKGSLTLSFDQITVRGRAYPMRGTVTDTVESGGYRKDAGKIGTGAVVGGIIGGILGGAKGALAGILVGGGGVVAATEGQEVDLKPGTVLRMRFDSALTLQN